MSEHTILPGQLSKGFGDLQKLIGRDAEVMGRMRRDGFFPI